MKMIELKKELVIKEESYTSVTYTILKNETAVGECSIMIDDDYAYCERIDIYEEFQRRGYGSEAFRELSGEYCGIVVAPDNEDAKMLYERLGCEWNGESTPYIDQGYGVFEI